MKKIAYKYPQSEIEAQQKENTSGPVLSKDIFKHAILNNNFDIDKIGHAIDNMLTEYVVTINSNVNSSYSVSNFVSHNSTLLVYEAETVPTYRGYGALQGNFITKQNKSI
jgi:hypothetical protein